MSLLKALAEKKASNMFLAEIIHISDIAIEYKSNVYTGVYIEKEGSGKEERAIILKNEVIQKGQRYILVGYPVKYKGVEVFLVSALQKCNTPIKINQLELSKKYKAYLMRLINVLGSVGNKHVHQFLEQIFSFPEILLPFSILPASSGHHHSYKFGLIEHSLECAEFCHDALKKHKNRYEADICTAASLLHDIGKIETLKKEKKLTQLGVYIPHDSLTLFTLQPFLKKLEQVWPIGAVILMYILTWDRTKEPIPKYSLSLLVKTADKLSVANNLSRLAFNDKPEYFHYSPLNLSGRVFYMNRLTPPMNSVEMEAVI